MSKLLTRKRNKAAVCWPNDTYELLLKAVLLKNSTAYTAWRKWLTQVDFFTDTLTGGSYQLLPLLYKNLLALGVDDPHMGRLKGITRHTWVRNQVYMKNVLPFLQSLDKAGIKSILLNRAALTFAIYEDDSLCLLDDFDIYFSPQDTDIARVLLSQAGFEPNIKTADNQTRLRKYHVSQTIFFHPDGNRIILHNYIPIHNTMDVLKSDIWEYAVPVILDKCATYALSPADHILTLCLNGLLLNRALAVDWFAHVAFILSNSKLNIDWQRFINLVQHCHLTIIIKHTLHNLADTFGVPIPASQLSTLDNLTFSRWEKREWRMISSASTGSRSSCLRLRRHWAGFKRTQAISDWNLVNPVSALAFYRYLRH